MKNLITIVPALGVLVAVIGLFYQIWRSKFSMNLDLVLKFDDKFNNPDFKKIRLKVSRTIFNKKMKNKFTDAEDVFDFFETVGYLVRHRALNKKIVWSTFYFWVHNYWSYGKDYIINERIEEKDKTIWEDFEWLHNELLKIERKETGKQEPEIASKEEILDFFKYEP